MPSPPAPSQPTPNAAPALPSQPASPANRPSSSHTPVSFFALIALVIAMSWIPFLLDLFFVDSNPPAQPDPYQRTQWLLLGIAATIIIPAIALWPRRRRLRLLETGIRVYGKPIEIAETGHGGMRTVTFAYLVNDVPYNLREQIADSVCLRYDEQTIVEIACDPQAPSRATVIDIDPDCIASSTSIWRSLWAALAGPFIALAISLLLVFGVWSCFRQRQLTDLTGAGLVFYAAALALLLDWAIVRLTARAHPLVKETYFRCALIAICLGAGVILTNT